MTAPAAPALGRRLVASAWAAILLPYLALALWVPVARALGVFGLVPVPVLVVLSVLAGPAVVAARPSLVAPLPACLDDLLDPANRRGATLWALGSLMAVFWFARLAIFLGDSRYVACSLIPADSFFLHHSCLSAYVHGAILSTDPAANVYDAAFLHIIREDLPLPDSAASFAPFKLDAFGYPPSFLLVPRALLLLTRDFASHRILFSAASLALVAYSCAALAKTLGGVAERRIWLLSPMLLASPPLLGALQVGNFHVATVAMSLLCWVALERRRDGLAGTLLAFAAMAKVFPGLLGAVLLIQRRWRAAAFAGVVAAATGALSLALLGPKVWTDFVFYQVPMIQSGEAYGFMTDSSQNIEFNLAPFGIPFKLAALGLKGWGWEQARLIGTLYSVLLLAVVVVGSRTRGGAGHRLTRWLALLMLASLRSPFAPPFVMVTVVLLLLVLATEARATRGAVGVFALWVLLLAALPVHLPPNIAASLARMIVLYAFLGWVVLRREGAPPSETLDGGRDDRAGG